MKLSEIDLKCEQRDSIKKEIESKKNDLLRLEKEDEKAKEDDEVQRMMAQVTGQVYEGRRELENLNKVRTEIETSEANLSNLERQILDGLKEITLDVLKRDISLNPNQEGQVTLNFEKSCANAVQFLASLLDSNSSVAIDNVMLYPDKVTISNVEKQIQVAKALEIFRANIKRLAVVALKENDPDVEEVAKSLYESTYRGIWEATKGRKIIKNQDLYDELNATEDKDKKKVQNFFTVMKSTWKDNKSLLTPLEGGKHELTFFGSLVWRRYFDDYLKTNKTVNQDIDIATPQKATKQEENNKTEPSLNKFFDQDQVKETIYGKKIK